MNRSSDPLFRLSPNPTLVVEDGCIVLSNPAADAFFVGSPIGRQITDHIPASLLQDPAEEFVVPFDFHGRPVTLTVSRVDGTLYLILHPQKAVPSEALIPPAVLHNIRTSLFNMKLSVELTLRQLCPEGVEPSPKAASHASIFQHNYYNILRTVTSMDTANALQDGSILFTPAMTNLNRLCENLLAAVRPLVADLGITLTFASRCDDELATAAVDRGLIEQMLLNLISNSLLHMQAGGSISLTLSHIRNQYVLSVDDTGSGIAPEILNTLFSRFEEPPTLADLSGGIGFGLFIAKGIAERHGGTLMVESRAGEGTSIRAVISDSLNPNLRLLDVGFEHTYSSMENILTQLATALPHSCYVPKVLDS